ncbi:hypothetical protein PUMCH_004253 [Australozyma saopauloensis]|uniref:Myosin motor domain-containing protein n=1 Tax=Australozyma saopauloensis TaxID=291208 RepID=A0AAX4HEC2_9ASCO|nr:hypothetical protein PUMCH_004253 [[Candida] saopauloensis]
MADEDLPTNNWVWIPDEDELFVRANITSYLENGMLKVAVKNGVQDSIREVNQKDVESCNPAKFNKCEDMAELTHLNEPSVIYNMFLRYNDDLIYTYSGLFLVAINPYKSLSIYDQTTLEKFHAAGVDQRLPPHIFAIAENTYRNLVANSKDQSILVTGESGAGKTENTKKVIQYLSLISTSAEEHNEIHEKILRANPILESFGNAKTVKNNNSSRFGKFIKIFFDAKGLICGATIDYYLLEKSRVSHQLKEERNYHAFYQLLQGCDPETLKHKYHLDTDYLKYKYLNQSAGSIANVDDASDYRQLCDSFRVMGFPEADIENICLSLAIILHLGNVDFTSWKAEQASFTEESNIQLISNLLGVSESDFSVNLLRPKVKAGREFVQTLKKPNEVKSVIDAFAKHLYEKIFQFIIVKINNSLMSAENLNEHFIGVLDIAGFEIFEINSFEQLCINYTNEKLQQFFNHHSFILEQSEYLREDIHWEYIDFGLDLQPTIDLIESKQPMGVLEILNDQCLVPNANEEAFINKLLDTWGNGESKKFRPNKVRSGFIIDHYAGLVEYNIDDWLQKNTDPISENILALMSTSSNEFIRHMFESEPSPSGRGSKFKTVTQRHKEQLSKLMKELGSTEPHFVRCILPNLNKKPNKFDKSLVLSQLRCNGVLEGIRIARAGFPNKMSYEDFFERYSILNSVDVFTKNMKTNGELILKHVNLDPDTYRTGITKVFFKNGILGHLEELRDASLKRVICKFQSLVRGKQARSKIQRQIEVVQASQVFSRNLLKLDEYVNQGKSPWLKLFINLKPLLEDSVKVLATTEMNESLKKLNGKIKEAEIAKAAVESENTSLKDRLCALEDEIMNVNQSHSEKLALLKTLELEEKTRDTKLRDTERQLVELKALGEKLSESKIELQTKYEQSQLKITELETLVENMKNELVKSNEQISQHKKEIETLQEQLKQYLNLQENLKKESSRYLALSTEHQLSKQKGEELQKAIDVCKAELEAKENKIAELVDLNNKAQENVSAMRSKSAEDALTTEKNNELTLRLQNVEKTLEEMNEEKRLLKIRISQLEAENTSLDQTRKRVLQEGENVKTALMSDKKREIDVLDSKLQTLNGKTVMLEKHLAEKTSELANQLELNEKQKLLIGEMSDSVNENKRLQDLLKSERNASVLALRNLEETKATMASHLLEHKQTLKSLEDLKNECQYLRKSKDDFSDQIMKLKAENQGLENKLQDKENMPPATPNYDPALVSEYAAMKTKFNEQSAVLRNEKFENQKLSEEIEMLREKVRGNFESPLKRSTARRSLQADDSMRASQMSDIRFAEEIKSLRIRLQQEEANVVRAENYAIELQKKLNKFQATRSVENNTDYSEKLRASQTRVEALESRLSALLNGSTDSPYDNSHLGMSRSGSFGAMSSASGTEFAKIYSDMNQTLKTTREELSKSKTEILRLKSLLRESEDELYEIKRESVKASVRDYEDQMARLKVANNNLTQETEDLKKSLSTHKKKCEEYYEKLELAESAAAMSKRQEEQCKQELKEKSVELRLMKDEVRAIDKIIRKLREDKHDLESSLKDLEVKEMKLRAINKNLQDQMAYLNNTYGDRKRSVEDYKEEIRALQADVKFKLEKETEIIKENKRLTIENEELQRIKEEVLAENSEINDENEKLSNQNDEHRQEIEHLTAAKQSHERKLEQNAKQIDSLHKIIEENGRQMEALNAFNRELESVKATHEDRIEKLENELKNTNINLEISREHGHNMEQSRQAAFAELEVIKGRWDSSDSRYKEARTENLVLVEENESLKTINAELGKKVGLLEEKLYSNEQIKFLETNLENLKQQIAQMKNEGLDRDAKEQKLQRQVGALEYDAENKSVQLKKYNDENFNLQNTVTQQKGKIEYLYQENNDKDLKIKAQERELKELRERLGDFRG